MGGTVPGVQNSNVARGWESAMGVNNTICLPQVLFSKKYGMSNIRFTHNINCVIYSSTKVW